MNRLAAALLSLADVARERREAIPTMECGPTLSGPLSEILDRAEQQQINQIRKEINVPRTDGHAYSRWTADGISRTIDHGEKR